MPSHQRCQGALLCLTEHISSPGSNERSVRKMLEGVLSLWSRGGAIPPQPPSLRGGHCQEEALSSRGSGRGPADTPRRAKNCSLTPSRERLRQPRGWWETGRGAALEAGGAHSEGTPAQGRSLCPGVTPTPDAKLPLPSRLRAGGVSAGATSGRRGRGLLCTLLDIKGLEV